MVLLYPYIYTAKLLINLRISPKIGQNLKLSSSYSYVNGVGWGWN